MNLIIPEAEVGSYQIGINDVYADFSNINKRMGTDKVLY